MSEIKFKVSAKAARLIGRENISDVDGAMIELVKNAYDADADSVFVKFIMPFPNVPKSITKQELENNFREDEIQQIQKYYEPKGQKYQKRQELSAEDNLYLQKLFFTKNKIIIIDNGTGMTEEIMKTSWMNIGTNDKEENAYSEKGRVKTGAKGIGRFALEKLSRNTEVYTKAKTDELIHWEINWDQFEQKKMLNEIRATIDKEKKEFCDMVRNELAEEFELVQNSNWDTGTMIILSPTREAWSERLFKKVNSNMQSINPLGSSDKFEVWIRNTKNPEYGFHTESLEIDKADYDYRIKADFDGDTIHIYLERNEVDIDKKSTNIIIDGKKHPLNIKEFWDREAFQIKNYQREDYQKEIQKVIRVKDILKEEELDKVKELGKFHLDLYFLKNGNSDFEIIKPIKVNNRKRLLKKFSGIKLYRDNFKVRPYGDDGSMYDWLNMGGRAQTSPASITHPSGSWRVLPYQLIGCINISRFENTHLTDMANREQLALNDCYYIFVDMIQNILSSFEYDRQYIYREYGLWLKQKQKEISITKAIIDSVTKEKEEKKENTREESKKEQEEWESYTKEDYKDTVYNMKKDAEQELKTMQILMAFSISGLIVNTFSHEMGRIATGLGSGMQQVELCVNYLLENKGYIGDEDFNPFIALNEVKATNELLNSWMGIVLGGVQQEKFLQKDIELNQIIENIIKIWEPLMDKKHIKFIQNTNDKKYFLHISEVDLHVIVNNFFLNCAWYLEEGRKNSKEIYIRVEQEENKLAIYLENNGPKLAEKYKDNPDKIFEAGETSKENNSGTGLGLWICKEVVNRNFGEIHTLDKEDGFGIKISFLK